MAINKTFSHALFKLVLQFAKNDNAADDGDELLTFLKMGKVQDEKQTIDKFGKLFLAEFLHFMRIVNMPGSTGDVWVHKQK